MAQPVPFYLDWTFWSFATAALAVLLSQIAPLRVLLRRSKLSIDVHDRIAIGHDVGYPVVDLYVGITNKGGKPTTLRTLELHVIRDGQPIVVLHARSYFATTNSQNPLLMVPTALQPDVPWGHVVKFLPDVPRLEEREVIARKFAVQNEIVAKRLADKEAGRPEQLQFADSATVDQLRAIFNRQFIWSPGDYRLQLVAKMNDGASRISSYTFVLFESESNELRSVVDEYAQGAGVFYPANRPGVFPKLSAQQ